MVASHFSKSPRASDLRQANCTAESAASVTSSDRIIYDSGNISIRPIRPGAGVISVGATLPLNRR